jgi:tRNA pseudouridine38-40 synthase
VEEPDTTRIRLTVQYDGSAFHGWQVQPGQRTVQGDLEAALSRLADRPRSLLAAGRTDTGVHATGQVACVDMPAAWEPDRLRHALNSILPGDIWVERALSARADFHPRYDAIARTYRYEVGVRPESASPFHRRWCWALCAPVDSDLLLGLSPELLGVHSFRAFAKAGQPERGDRCEIAAAAWSETALGFGFSVTADRYLHHMVRYLVGTMIDIARERRPHADLARLLAGDPARTTSPPAPPQGLFLTSVEYPEDARPDHEPESPPSRSATTA